MIATRYAKIVMILGLSLFCLIITAEDIIDYWSNVSFVKHILSMDSTFPGNILYWRANTDTPLHHVGYCLIIVSDALTGLCFFFCAWKLAANVNAQARDFHRVKSLGVIAATIGFANWFIGFMINWFIGFMIEGGEWFSIWQSKIWNGQQAAFYFHMTMLTVLIFLMQQDDELALHQCRPYVEETDAPHLGSLMSLDAPSLERFRRFHDHRWF